MPIRLFRPRFAPFFALWLVLTLPLAPSLRAADGPTTRPGKLFMWKAIGKSGGIVYLVGSMHLAVPSIYPLPKPMETAFAKADTLAVEADITTVDQMAMLKKITETGMYAGEDSLPKHLSKETKTALDAYCKTSGLPAMLLDKMKPWLAAITVEAMAIQGLGLDPANGIDMHFLTAAHTAKKNIQELESADFQLNLLAGFPDDVQDKELAATLKEMAGAPKLLDAIKDAWVAGDAKKMDDITESETKDDKTSQMVKKKLVDDRNVPMTEKIVKDVEAGHTTFVVVGAAHLGGDKGILRLLAAKGYKVTQATRE